MFPIIFLEKISFQSIQKNDPQGCFNFFFSRKQKNTSTESIFFFLVGYIVLLLKDKKKTTQVLNFGRFVEKFQNFAFVIRIITFLNSHENIKKHLF
jgi:hypothetical protein